MIEDNYFIKDEYIARTEAHTIESEPMEYWNDDRIKSSESCQYYVYKHVRSILHERSTGKRAVADIGCGYPVKTEKLIRESADFVDLYDQPTLSGIIQSNFERMNFFPLDLERPCNIEKKYDVVICADVIEHLISPDPCLEYLKSIIKPDGLIVLSTPERDILRGRDCIRSEKLEHVREWNKDEFSKYISSRGLKIMRHEMLPELKLSMIESMCLSLFRRFLHGRKWNGCQLLIGELKD